MSDAKKEALERYRDAVLEEIEDLTVLIYENQVEIGKLEEMIRAEAQEDGEGWKLGV